MMLAMVAAIRGHRRPVPELGNPLVVWILVGVAAVAVMRWLRILTEAAGGRSSG